MTVTREGSVARRAIDCLAGLPEGAELACGELVEHLGIGSKSLLPCLKSAIRAGEIRVNMANPRKHLYSVPAPGAPRRAASVFDLAGTAAVEANARSDAPPRATRKANGKAQAKALGATPTAELSWRTRATPAPTRTVQPAPAGDPPSLDCALFHSGALLIEAPGAAPLRLSREQARDLVAYLQRIANALETSAA